MDACTAHVGAVNCVNHRALCGSLEARRYPSLLAINWPGALPPVDGIPATKIIASQSTPDELVQAVHNIFELPEEGIMCNEACVIKEPRELGTIQLEWEEATYAKPKAEKRCEERLQQAVNSIRLLFLNDIFTEGTTLCDERVGEWTGVGGYSPCWRCSVSCSSHHSALGWLTALLEDCALDDGECLSAWHDLMSLANP